MTVNLDMDCLRTLVSVAETGTRARAAETVGRTPAAVSLQIGRLEERLGVALFRRVGRRMVFTEEGERLLGYARRILAVNDEALAALSPQRIEGPVRFGTTQDFADTILAGVLGDFTRVHPGVRLKVRVETSAALVEAAERGVLHLVLAVVGSGDLNAEPVIRLPMQWLGAPGLTLDPEVPVPLILFEPPCPFRKAALEALDRAGRPWRIAYTSPSLSGLRAAVEAGLGVTVRTDLFRGAAGAAPAQVADLPRLPEVAYGLYSGCTPFPALDRLRSTVESALNGYRPGPS